MVLLLVRFFLIVDTNHKYDTRHRIRAYSFQLYGVRLEIILFVQETNRCSTFLGLIGSPVIIAGRDLLRFFCF